MISVKSLDESYLLHNHTYNHHFLPKDSFFIAIIKKIDYKYYKTGCKLVSMKS